jgi:hypothetical protein
MNLRVAAEGVGAWGAGGDEIGGEAGELVKRGGTRGGVARQEE